MKKKYNNILIIGLGMMGVSLCHSIKKNNIAKKVTGYDKDRNAIKYSLKNNLINSGLTELSNINDVDLIIICTPIGAYETTINKLIKIISYNTILTDIGSAKGETYRKAILKLKKSKISYVSSHPMVGSEKSGSNNYIKDMYKNRITFLIDRNSQNKSAYSKVRDFWRSIGSNTYDISSRKHDLVMSQTSHIAHLLSFMFVKVLPKSIIKKDLSLLMGGGIKEHIRLSKSDSDMWSDIFIDNRKNLINSITKINKQLLNLKKLLQNSNKNAIKSSLKGVQKKTK